MNDFDALRDALKSPTIPNDTEDVDGESTDQQSDENSPEVAAERLTLTYQYLPRNGDAVTNSYVQPLPSFNQKSLSQGLLLQERYRLVRELGRGGFGVVYLAKDVRLFRDVAIKMLLPNRVQNSSNLEALEELFTEEAQVAASLHHSAIANIFDIGIHDGLPYMVFEYVAGESLRDRMRRHRKWSVEEIRRFVLPISGALDYAHRLRVVHRDLKPENIRITINGEYKILDLGLARKFDGTSDWRFAGTPAYASPEQAAELPSDGRMDQYALSVIVYEMLTGIRPFLSNSPYELLEMHQHQIPIHPRSIASDVTERIAQTVLRGLCKDPTKRFASCAEFAASLGCDVPNRAFEVDHNEILIEAAVTIRSQMILGLERGNLLLTSRVLWTAFHESVQAIPIDAIQVCKTLFGGRTLEIAYVAAGRKSKILRFDFPGTTSCQVWCQRISELMPIKTTAIATELSRPVPVITSACTTRHQVLGHFRVEGFSVDDCFRRSQIRGAMVDADAVLSEEAQIGQLDVAQHQDESNVEGRMGFIEGFRRVLLLPFDLVVSPIRWLAKLAGGDESQGERSKSGSFVAVRARHADERREIMITSLRGELTTAGNWLLICVAVAWLIDHFPNISVAYMNVWATAITTTYAVDAKVIDGIGRFAAKIPIVVASVLLGIWPLVMALAVRVRKTGLLVEPAGITFVIWGIGGYAHMMKDRLQGLNVNSNFYWQLLFGCVLLWIGVVVFRIGKQFTNIIRFTDQKLTKKRFVSIAWGATLIYGILISGMLDWLIYYMIRK